MRDVVLLKVCRKGSLGCVSFTGGPIAHCDCVSNGAEILLPYIVDDGPRPAKEVVSCPKCDTGEYNVHELLLKQVSTRQFVYTI